MTVDEWKAEVQRELLFRIKDWEMKMGEDDRSLFSLGLRVALDIVMGRSELDEDDDTPHG